jgi:hypothetical protein
MEIQPATLAQVRQGRDGRRVLIEEDVLDVARRLQAIDPSLALHWNENGNYFVLTETDAAGTERMVLTAQELDDRLLARVQQIMHPSYDYAAELDRQDRQADRERDHRFAEQTGEVGERLAHAVRKDIQAKNKIIVP